MKYLILIVSLIFINCKAQTPILSRYDVNTSLGDVPNAYYKDVDNFVVPLVIDSVRDFAGEPGVVEPGQITISPYSTVGNGTNAKSQGVELFIQHAFDNGFGINANYTYTDSEQKSGANKGQPLTNTAKHMANLTIDWNATDELKVFLTSEIRTKRFRAWDTVNNAPLNYKAYDVYHLGASYAASDSVTFTARINNLFDQDFTTYDLEFVECDSGTSCILDANGANGYQASYVDHFNNKDKARNLWMSVNVSF